MNFDWAELISAIQSLEAVSPNQDIDDGDLAAQFRVHSALRKALICIPNDRLKRDQYGAYLRRVLGKPPSSEMVQLVERAVRGQRPSLEDYEVLERLQNCRCALCGVILTKEVQPHLDHIHPVAYGGASKASNLQILCSRCNLGKSDSLHWIMADPFFADRSEHTISLKVRYSVFARYQGKCAVLGCAQSSRQTEMHVDPVISIQEGGRLIFDNLRALCSDHHVAEIQLLQKSARRSAAKAAFRARTAR